MSALAKSILKTASVNLLTFSRLVAGIVSVFVFGQQSAAGALAVVFFYIFVSDLADGYLARLWHVTTKGGAIFDYAVDRFNVYLQVALLVSAGVPVWYFLPFFLRDMLYIFVQTYVARERISGTKSLSFVGTVSVYLYVLFIAYSGGVGSYLNLVLLGALTLSLANMLLRTYRLRHELAEQVRQDFLI